MENKFYKVFCGALVFGAIASILFAIVLICGGDCTFTTTGENSVIYSLGLWCFLIVCMIIPMAIAIIAMIFMHRDFTKKEEDTKKAKSNIEDDDSQNDKEKIKQLEDNLAKANKQLDMIKHEEKMALIKQLGKGAPDSEILKLLQNWMKLTD